MPGYKYAPQLQIMWIKFQFSDMLSVKGTG